MAVLTGATALPAVAGHNQSGKPWPHAAAEARSAPRHAAPAQNHPTSSADALGASIVDNGGFETPAGTDGAASWLQHDYYNRTVCTASGTYCANPYSTFYGAPSTAPTETRDATVARTGSASAKLVYNGGAPAMYDQAISPAGPRTYTLTFWARSSGPSPTANVDARDAFVRDFFGADRWSFPADGQWHQLLGSTYVPSSQKDVLLALRSTTGGQPVWIDDVALRPVPFNVTHLALGRQTVGDNAARFAVQATATVPTGLTFRLDVLGPDGSTQTHDVPLPAMRAGEVRTLDVPYITNAAGVYYLDPSVLQGDQTVWHVVKALQGKNDPYVGTPVRSGYPNLMFTLSDGADTTLTSPSYHRAIFPGDGVRSVSVRTQLVLRPGEHASDYRYSATLTDADGKVLATRSDANAPATDFQVSFPASVLPQPTRGQGAAFAADDYTVTVSVTGPDGHTTTSKQTFRKLGDSPDGVQVTRDDHQVVRVDGKPFFPVGLYRADDLDSLQTGKFNLSLWDPTFPHNLPTPGSDTYKAEMAAGVRYVVDVSPLSWIQNPFTHQPLDINGTTTSYGVCKGNYTEPVTCMDDYLTTMVDLLRNDPQVIGYAFQDEYLYDAYIQHAYDFLVQHDPYRFVFETAHTPFDDVNIVHAADVLAADPYAIKPTVPESVLEVSVQLDILREAATDTHNTIWLVPQFFAGVPGWTKPTVGQARAMFYLGLLHGATGEYGYATYSGEVNVMPGDCARWPGAPDNLFGPGDAYQLHFYIWCTDLWPEFIQLGHEADRLFAPLAYGADTTDAWSIGAPVKTSSLDYTVRRYEGHTYLVVQNTSDAPESGTFTTAGPERGQIAAGNLRELFSGENDATAGGELSTRGGELSAAFAAYQTRVFVIG